MLFKKLLRKKLTFKEYLPHAVNINGYEHRKFAIRTMVGLMDEFTRFKRNSAILKVEVEALNNMETDTLKSYDDMTVGEIKDLVSKGGEICDTFLANIIYNIHKYDNSITESNTVIEDVQSMHIINKKILWLEKVIIKIKKLQN